VESNIKNANLEEYITIEEKNLDTEKTRGNCTWYLILLTERLDIHMKNSTKILTLLKKNYPGTNAWFITGNLEG
jgi:putative N6-adenine-specific DNA methylase